MCLHLCVVPSPSCYTQRHTSGLALGFLRHTHPPTSKQFQMKTTSLFHDETCKEKAGHRVTVELECLSLLMMDSAQQHCDTLSLGWEALFKGFNEEICQ